VPPAPERSTIYDRILSAMHAGDRAALKAIREEIVAGAVPPPLPDADNGALAYLAAFQKLVALPQAFYEAMEAIRRGDLSAARFEELRRAVEANAGVIEMLKEAGTFARCRYPVAYEEGFEAELPHIP
jgi:hypothetical protein